LVVVCWSWCVIRVGDRCRVGGVVTGHQDAGCVLWKTMWLWQQGRRCCRSRNGITCLMGCGDIWKR
jgi:hypothetical protein